MAEEFWKQGECCTNKNIAQKFYLLRERCGVKDDITTRIEKKNRLKRIYVSRPMRQK